MATFYNQATLTYRSGAANSNIAEGELLDAVSLTKTALSSGYAPGQRVTFAIGFVNNGPSPLTDETLTDNLGAYDPGSGTVYPLAFVPDSLRLFVDGVPVSTAGLTAQPGPPLTVTGLTLPVGGAAVLTYEAEVTPYAPLGEGAEIENTAVFADVSASSTLSPDNAPQLTIFKSVAPQAVTAGEQATYTFVIQNAGGAADASQALVASDVFNPVLQNVSVTLNGTALTPDTDYTYDEATGAFTTAAGVIAVPAAVSAQTPEGVWVVTPGTATLTVQGVI